MSAVRSSGRRDPRTPRTAPRRRAGAARVGAAGDAAAHAADAEQPPPSRSAAAATATLEPPTHVPAPTARPSRRRRDRTRERPRPPRHRLLLVCTAVLAVGLFGVLLLNTIISQGAFRQHELEIDLILLAEKEEALARAVQAAEAPLEVEKRARALGMVAAAAPVFLRLSDGKVLGEPVAASPAGPVDFADAPGMQPTPAPSPSGAAGADSEALPAAEPTVGPSVDPALDPSTGLVDDAASPSAAVPAPASPAPVPSVQQDGASPAPTSQAGSQAPTPQGGTP